jgi:hypothetical protein
MENVKKKKASGGHRKSLRLSFWYLLDKSDHGLLQQGVII